MEKFTEFVMHHWPLWLALVVIVVLLIIEETKGKLFGLNNISPQDLIPLMNRDQAAVIDLRDKKAFDAGHIIGANNIALKDLETNLSLEKYKDKTIVLVSNGAPLKISSQLQKQGFPIFVLAGGIDGWRNAGFPIIRS